MQTEVPLNTDGFDIGYIIETRLLGVVPASPQEPHTCRLFFAEDKPYHHAISRSAVVRRDDDAYAYAALVGRRVRVTVAIDTSYTTKMLFVPNHPEGVVRSCEAIVGDPADDPCMTYAVQGYLRGAPDPDVLRRNHWPTTYAVLAETPEGDGGLTGAYSSSDQIKTLAEAGDGALVRLTARGRIIERGRFEIVRAAARARPLAA